MLNKKADSRFQFSKVNEYFFILFGEKHILLISEQQTINLL